MDLTRQGVLLQVNAETLLDKARRSDGDRLARYLCAQGLVHALASDGHRAAVWRPVTCLAEVIPAAVALVGPERAHWMMQTRARRGHRRRRDPGRPAAPDRAAEIQAPAATVRKG